MPADADAEPAPAARSRSTSAAPRRIHVVGIGGAGMSAIALVLRAMGHTVSGSDLKDSPVAERLRSHGITVAVGHRPENVAGADAVTYSPAVPPENPELVRGPGGRDPRRPPLRDARRHLRHPPLPRRGRDAREDDDGLHAVADPGGGGAAAVLRHRGRRQRDRHQRGVGHRGVARRRGRRELRDVPGHPPRPGRADQRRARPPRLLRHLRGAARRLRRLPGRRAPGRGRVRGRSRGGGHRARSTVPITVGSAPGSTYAHRRPRPAAQLGVVHPARARRGAGHAADRRPRAAQRPQRGDGRGGGARRPARPSRRRRRRWPASPG